MPFRPKPILAMPFRPLPFRPMPFGPIAIWANAISANSHFGKFLQWAWELQAFITLTSWHSLPNLLYHCFSLFVNGLMRVRWEGEEQMAFICLCLSTLWKPLKHSPFRPAIRANAISTNSHASNYNHFFNFVLKRGSFSGSMLKKGGGAVPFTYFRECLMWHCMLKVVP